VRLIRYASLDILRGIAISAMIIADTPAIISKGAFMPFCGVIALPFFLICSGISYEFYIDSRLQRGLAKNELSIETIFRVVVLLFIAEISLFEGYILYPGHFKFGFYWGVFQLIAAGYLFSIS